ncbi:hypothetical protein FHZ98_13305 [Listeria monocytogenes]|nr:hypothetical protein [Listeria monocytogenes]
MSIEDFFIELAREFKQLNNVHAATALKNIESIKYDVIDILSKYAESDGTIHRSKNAKIMRELDKLFPEFNADINETIREVIEETASWTTDKLFKYFAVTYGVALVANSAKESIKSSIVNDAFKYKWENGLTLHDSTFWLSRSLHDAIRISVNINSKKGFQEAVKGVNKALEKERWRTENIIRSDGPNTYRRAIIENGKRSKYVKGWHITEGIHRSPKCVALANADHYGMGRGNYPEETTFSIESPHPRCTSFLTYIMTAREDGLFDDYE